MPNKLINLEFLKENTFGSKPAIVELLALFINTTGPMLSDLNKYCQAGDWNLLRQMAHKLKSSFSLLGVNEVETLLAQLENYDGSANTKEFICGSIERIMELTAVVNKELETEMEMLKN